MPRPALRDYQQVGIEHLQRWPGAGLFLDMGMGKTRIVLEALRPEHLPALVIAPKRVAEEVWPHEVPKWSGWLDLALATGNADQRKKILASDADIVVLGRDNIANAVEVATAGVRSPLHRPPFRTLVLDELSNYKSRGAWFRGARKLRKGVQNVWGLTGTPSPNSYLDLWAEVGLLDGGQRLGKTFTGYQERYFTPGRRNAKGIIIGWNLRPGAREEIDQLISDICISMGEERLGDERVPVQYNEVHVPLPTAALRAYDDMRKTFLADLVDIHGEVHTAADAGVASNKLAQISAGFMYVDDADVRGGKYDVIHHEKIKAAREVVDGTGSPVLMFYRYRPEREMLLKAIPEAQTLEKPGVIGAWNRSEVPVLLAHPLEIGHGLNLQEGDGHTICWASRSYSLEEWEQGNKRLARPGQRHPVMIHTLMANVPVDRAIDSALTGKASVQDALRTALDSPF